MFGEKKYKVTQSQVDEMNKVYADIKTDNALLRKQNQELKADRESNLDFNKCKSLEEENIFLKSELEMLTDKLKQANITMSTVLETLEITNKAYENYKCRVGLFLDSDLSPITKGELNILA